MTRWTTLYSTQDDEIPGLGNVCLWLPSMLYYLSHSIVRLVMVARWL